MNMILRLLFDKITTTLSLRDQTPNLRGTPRNNLFKAVYG